MREGVNMRIEGEREIGWHTLVALHDNPDLGADALVDEFCFGG